MRLSVVNLHRSTINFIFYMYISVINIYIVYLLKENLIYLEVLQWSPRCGVPYNCAMLFAPGMHVLTPGTHHLQWNWTFNWVSCLIIALLLNLSCHVRFLCNNCTVFARQRVDCRCCGRRVRGGKARTCCQWSGVGLSTRLAWSSSVCCRLKWRCVDLTCQAAGEGQTMALSWRRVGGGKMGSDEAVKQNSSTGNRTLPTAMSVRNLGQSPRVLGLQAILDGRRNRLPSRRGTWESLPSPLPVMSLLPMAVHQRMQIWGLYIFSCKWCRCIYQIYLWI